MKLISLVSSARGAALACAVLSSSLYASVAGAAEYVGRLASITEQIVTIENVGDFKIDLKKAQCFDHRGDQTTCATLVGIGYADKVKVTVLNDAVKRVDVLELKQ